MLRDRASGRNWGARMKLQGKVALVTGTSPNIGGGIVEELAAAGASVVCVDSDRANAEDAARYLRSRGANALGLVCDVCDEAQAEAAVARTVKDMGRLDILVNNAATFNRKGVLDMSVEEWRRQIDVILTGTFLYTRHAAKSMIASGVPGSIINIISTAGHQGEPGNIAYGTAKGGLLNFTRSAAMEFASQAIRVNSITPTATDPSESFERAKRWGRAVEGSPRIQAFERFRLRSPLQKLPAPSDYGRAAVFLASDDAAMITGTDLRVDAGAVARYWAWDPPAR
jgi:NAD(P)-dependent dehydrogenase (short-subunit alcohol dehydrogenase family)